MQLAYQQKLKEIAQQPLPIVTSDLEKRWVKMRVIKQFFGIALRKNRNPIKAISVIRQVRAKYKAVFGDTMLTKVAKVDNRYFWRLAAPGFPSSASIRANENELNRFVPCESSYGLRSLLFAITKKCALNCEHCFEWENLNQKEVLSTSDLIQIVNKYQEYGTTQIMLSGGEPMLRINDIYKLLKVARPGTDFWIITSGRGLTKESAKQLKAHGLTGVMVSLDHHVASKHDQFRGRDGSFDDAIAAVVHANDANLVTCLSLCPTKEFLKSENLSAYMDLARSLGVAIVQLVEPRAAGRYRDQNVELGTEEVNMLEEAYLKYNSHKDYKDYPIINYTGYHQRRMGCFAGGDRFFYIDTDGDAHICPFCTRKVASSLKFEPRDLINLLQDHSCYVFDENKVL